MEEKPRQLQETYTFRYIAHVGGACVSHVTVECTLVIHSREVTFEMCVQGKGKSLFLHAWLFVLTNADLQNRLAGGEHDTKNRLPFAC